MLGDFEIEATDGTGASDDCRPAETGVAEMVVARNRQDAKFVVEDAVQNIDYARGDAVISGAFFLDDIVGFIFDEIGNVGTNVFVEEFGDRLAAKLGDGP